MKKQLGKAQFGYGHGSTNALFQEPRNVWSFTVSLVNEILFLSIIHGRITLKSKVGYSTFFFSIGFLENLFLVYFKSLSQVFTKYLLPSTHQIMFETTETCASFSALGSYGITIGPFRFDDHTYYRFQFRLIIPLSGSIDLAHSRIINFSASY